MPRCRSATRSSRRRTSTAISPTRRTRPHYEFTFNQSAIYYETRSTTWAAIRAALRPTTNRPRSRPSRRGCSRRADSDSRWGWLVGAFYSKETGYTEFDSYVRDYEDTPAFEYFSDLRDLPDRQSARADRDAGSSGATTPNSSRRPCSASCRFDVTENFTITAGGRWFDYKRKFSQHQEAPEGFSGYSLLDAQTRNEGRRHGREAEPELSHRR